MGNITPKNLDAYEHVRQLIAALAASQKDVLERCQNWKQVHIEITKNNGLGAWLYSELKNWPAAGLRADLLEIFHKDYLFSAANYWLQEKSLKEILHRFELQGIPLILLKGIYLGREIYKNPLVRPMTDLDLMVRPEDFDRAQLELVSMGYRFVEGAERAHHRELMLPLAYFRNENTSENVDLHRAIRAMDYYCISSSAIWNETSEGDFCGLRVRYLSPEINFIHLALHNLTHAGLLRDWLDLVLLLRRTNFDWDKLVYLAKLFKVMRPLEVVLNELTRNWKTQLPDIVMIELENYKPRWLENRIISGYFCRYWRIFSRITQLPGWKSRLMYLRTKL